MFFVQAEGYHMVKPLWQMCSQNFWVKVVGGKEEDNSKIFHEQNPDKGESLWGLVCSISFSEKLESKWLSVLVPSTFKILTFKRLQILNTFRFFLLIRFLWYYQVKFYLWIFSLLAIVTNNHEAEIFRGIEQGFWHLLGFHSNP